MNTANRGDWKSDEFAAREVIAQHSIFFLPWICLFLAILFLIPLTLLRGCFTDSTATVVVYTAQDQVFAEPIFQTFTKETGIRVRAVYDSEAVKTVGLANRLLAEKARPQCDVFWSNEELRTRQLAAAGFFRATNGWASFGHRSRRLAVGTHDPALPVPQSWQELTNAVYAKKIVLAYPLFGTTSTHLLALRQAWGESNWLTWCRALAANQPWIVDGNSVAARWVREGKASLGWTDSDDIAAEIREGGKLRALPLTADSLLIPNTVAVVRQCPHPENAEKLFRYLQNPSVLAALRAVDALESPVSTAETPPTLQPDWAQLLRELPRGTEQLKDLFRR